MALQSGRKVSARELLLFQVWNNSFPSLESELQGMADPAPFSFNPGLGDGQACQSRGSSLFKNQHPGGYFALTKGSSSSWLRLPQVPSQQKNHPGVISSAQTAKLQSASLNKAVHNLRTACGKFLSPGSPAPICLSNEAIHTASLWDRLRAAACGEGAWGIPSLSAEGKPITISLLRATFGQARRGTLGISWDA